MHADPMAEAFALAEENPDCYITARQPDRDPHKSPQPGDVLAVGTDVREVLRAGHGRIEYGFPGKAATRNIARILWDVWARNAQVRKVAP